MAQVPAPENQLVTVVNIIIDGVIKGASADVIIAKAVTAAPWLAYPIISKLFIALVKFYAGKIDSALKGNIDVLIIRFQNNALQKKYDDLISTFKEDKVKTDAELKAAYATIDSLVHRSR